MKYTVEFIWGPLDGEIIITENLKKEYYMPYRTSYETIDQGGNYSVEWYEMIYQFEEIKYGKYKYRFKGWQ